jgi:hypothetical protein
MNILTGKIEGDVLAYDCVNESSVIAHISTSFSKILSNVYRYKHYVYYNGHRLCEIISNI